MDDKKSKASLMQQELARKQEYAASRGLLGFDNLYKYATGQFQPQVALVDEAGMGDTGSQVKYDLTPEQAEARARNDLQMRQAEAGPGVVGRPGESSLIDRLKFWESPAEQRKNRSK